MTYLRSVPPGHIGWTDLRVPLSATKAGGSKDPTYAKFRDDGAGSQGVFAWQFPSTSETEVYFETQLPHEWIAGTELRPHVHWSPGAVTAGGVRWGLEYTISNPVNAPGNVFPTTTLVGVTQAAGGLGYDHQIAQLPAIDATGLRVSCVLLGRLFRDTAHADDTMAGPAIALSFDLHFQQIGPGSVTEYPGA